MAIYATLIEKDILLRLTRSVRTGCWHCILVAGLLMSWLIELQGSASTTIFVRTTFPYTESHYTVCIHHAKTTGKQKKEELYVGRYFDRDGYFNKESFTKDIAAISSRFEKEDKKQ